MNNANRNYDYILSDLKSTRATGNFQTAPYVNAQNNDLITYSVLRRSQLEMSTHWGAGSMHASYCISSAWEWERLGSHESHGIPMGMGIRSGMGWEWDGNGNKVHGNGNEVIEMGGICYEKSIPAHL